MGNLLNFLKYDGYAINFFYLTLNTIANPWKVAFFVASYSIEMCL